MAYTNVWNDAAPTGAEAANTIDDIFRSLKVDIEQRFIDIFNMANFTDDPLRPGGLKFYDTADAKIFLGDNGGTPRSILIRDKADTTTYVTIAYNGITAPLFTGPVVATTLSASTSLAVAATAKIYLDGVAASGDTYWSESSANNARLTVGGTAVVNWTSSGGAVTGTLSSTGLFSSQTGIKVLKNGSGTFGSGAYAALFNAADTDGMLWQLNASNGLSLWSWIASSAVERIVINNTGQVGIGAAIDASAQFLVAGGTTFSTIAKWSRAGGTASTTGDLTLLLSSGVTGSTGADAILSTPAGSGFRFRTNGTTSALDITIGQVVIAYNDIVIPATNKLRIDGSSSGDTYLYESSANVLDIFVGGANMLKLTSTVMQTVATTVVIGSSTNSNLNLQFNGTPGADNSGRIDIVTSNSARNWQIGSNNLTGSALTFTPSTVGGGGSFTTPVLTLLSTSVSVSVDFLTSNSAANTYIQVNNTGANVPHFYITRQGGTVSNFDIYLPAGSTDLRFTSSTTSDVFILTAAGLLTIKSDFVIPATSKLRIDGSASGDTYFYESSANNISIFAGGSQVLQLSTYIDLFIDSGVRATKKFYFDGGGDTYISESSANVMKFTVGGTDLLFANSTLLAFNGTSSSFPGIKRSSTSIQIRLADDSDYAGLSCKTIETDPIGAVPRSTWKFGAYVGGAPFTHTGVILVNIDGVSYTIEAST